MSTNFLTDLEKQSLAGNNKSTDKYSFLLTGLKDDQFISGVMQNALSFGGSNSFTSKGAELRDRPVVGGAYSAMDKVNQVRGVRFSGHSMFSQGEMTDLWTDSNKPSFSISFTLLAHTAQEAVRNQAKVLALQSAVLPVGGGSLLTAPLGYKGNGSGTLELAVGVWFKAPKLIMHSLTASADRQVMYNGGNPLSWTISMDLQPYRMITISDFEKYFIVPKIAIAGAENKLSQEDQKTLFSRATEKAKSFFA